MTDSVYVFPPGERITDDSTGAPVIGATVYFYDAGTANPKTVYADADLTASLGTSIITDSLGYPTSDGTTRTLIYVGTAPYKIVVKDADGVTSFTHDDIPGAPQSSSPNDEAVTALFPVVTKSLAYTVLAADQNTTFLINCSSANVTLTLPSATDSNIPNGWKITVQHAGSANKALVVVKSGSGQNIYEGKKTYGGASFVLSLNGEDCEIVADGGNWRVIAHTPPFLKNSQGIIPVVSRLATSPGSPAAGDIYILTGNGGSWSTFTTGDLAVYTGAGWINFTPPTNCGWVAYVQADNGYNRFKSSSWSWEGATDTARGTAEIADQSEMEAATDLGRMVVPGRQKFHPGHPKAWGYFSGPATLSVKASYGVSSIVRNSAGVYTVNLSTNMSSVNYAVICSSGTGATDNGSAVHNAYATSKAVGSFVIVTSDNNFNRYDDNNIDFIVLGDL